jgi:hypothetical protein
MAPQRRSAVVQQSPATLELVLSLSGCSGLEGWNRINEPCVVVSRDVVHVATM